MPIQQVTLKLLMRLNHDIGKFNKTHVIPFESWREAGIGTREASIGTREASIGTIALPTIKLCSGSDEDIFEAKERLNVALREHLLIRYLWCALAKQSKNVLFIRVKNLTDLKSVRHIIFASVTA
jgi:hypothetical protein